MNRNPLGSAAGYGSSAPLDRGLTTRLLGFDDLDYNVVYAQMSRGKTERIVAAAYASVAETLGRLAFDCCLYASQNFAFIHLPDKMTTGSSIMPHKKNPDVFELIRAHCNRICGIQNSLRLITTNLPSGYFRDMQLLKEEYLPLFDEMDDCLDIAAYAIENMEVEQSLMEDPRYRLAFTVEEVNHLVENGVPFRDAYRVSGEAVALCIASGRNLETLPLEEYQSMCSLIDSDVYEHIDIKTCVEKRTSVGGTSTDSVKAQIAYARSKVL